MTSPALSTSSFSISKGQWCQLDNGFAIRSWNHPSSATCSLRLPGMVQFGKPPKVMMQVNSVGKKLSEIIPHSVKDFPWKKAEDTMLRQLLLVGRKALKWSLLALYVCCSVSDVIYSITRNKELMIPFGLFVGCIMTNFLIETFQELFPISEESGRQQHLLGIGCILAVIKIVSAYFVLQGRIFLLHATNGGLMQVLWLWRSLKENQDRVNLIEEDAYIA